MPQRSDIFFSHGRDLAGFEPRTFRFQGFPEGRSGCERISPDPLGYGATQQIGRNLKLIYPTLGLGPGHVPQRSDIFFSHGRDLAGFEPRTFRFQGFPEGRSGCERISPDPLGYGATRSSTMVTLHDTRFVKCRWWNDGWTVKTVVT